MKKLNELRQRKIMLMAFMILGLIAGLMTFTAPEKAASGIGIAALTIGGVTLSDTEEKVYTALQEAIKTEMSKFDKGYITETKMNEAIAEAIKKSKINLADDEEWKKLNAVLEKQGLEIVSLKESNNPFSKFKSLEEQMKEQLGEYKSPIDALRASGSKNLEFTFKLPLNPITVATMVSPASGYIPVPTIEPGYDRAPVLARIIRGIANVSKIGTPLAVWAEKHSEEGSAAWLGEGGVKPPISFKVRTKNSAAKKVAVSARFSTETLQDIPSFMGELRSEILDAIEDAEETAFLTGDGQGDNPQGVIPIATGYTLVGIFTDNANNFDAIKAACTQVRMLGHRPDVCLVNGVDFANMSLSKGSDGHYLLPPFSTADGSIISGVKIMESKDIDVGKFLIGDWKKFNIRDYIELSISLGWINDDFTKNFVAVVGEKRLMTYVKEHQKPGFIYDDFAVVKAAIETPAVPEPPVG